MKRKLDATTEQAPKSQKIDIPLPMVDLIIGNILAYLPLAAKVSFSLTCKLVLELLAYDEDYQIYLEIDRKFATHSYFPDFLQGYAQCKRLLQATTTIQPIYMSCIVSDDDAGSLEFWLNVLVHNKVDKKFYLLIVMDDVHDFFAMVTEESTYVDFYSKYCPPPPVNYLILKDYSKYVQKLLFPESIDIAKSKYYFSNARGFPELLSSSWMELIEHFERCKLPMNSITGMLKKYCNK